MNKLTNVEAQRVMFVLEESLIKLDHLGLLTPEAMANLDHIRSHFGSQVAEQFMEHKEMEERLDNMITAAGGGNNRGGSMVFKDNQEIREYSLDIRQSVRNICRLFKQHPEIADFFRSVSTDTSKSLQKFQKTLQELKNLTFQRLLTSVEEDKAQKDYVSDLTAREKKASAEVKALQRELAAEKREREKAVSMRNETITKLKDEIQEIKSTAALDNTTLKKETTNQEEADLSEFQAHEAKLLEEIKQLTDLLEQEAGTNRQDEESLRKKKYLSEVHLQQTIGEYDEDMEKRVKELEMLQAAFDEELRQLTDLEAWYEDQKKLEEERLAEEKEFAKLMAIEAEKQKKLDDAAMMIQKIMRGYLTRKLLKSKQGKPKKGKKGKKGKGKK